MGKLRKRDTASHGRNGAAGAPGALALDDDRRIAQLFGPLRASPEQIRRYRTDPASEREPWDVLLSTLAVDEHTALRALAERTGLVFEDEPILDDSASRFYELVTPAEARELLMAGLSSDGRSMRIATAQPMQPGAFSLLEDRLGLAIEVVLAPRAAVANLLNRGYERRQDLVTEIVEDMPLDEQAMASAAGAIGRSTDLLQLARQGPVIRLVNMILFEALRRRSSDVHIHPEENRLVIRMRVDGMLVDAFSPPLGLASAISSRLKVMTDLDIANRHSPQDGQTTVRVGSHKIDIRLSVIPTIHGERIVLRLLDQSQTQLDLDSLGMGAATRKILMDAVARPNGMLLVTGPTGSGKTTTLYAALAMIDRDTRNVMTIEDPVEYRLEGISQMQVNPKRGVTFATGLRSLLRQDPDVILVGEIRDHETAELAVQASLTGHLVLATLHTNDAPSAIPRLLDIGVEPFLVTSSLLGVMAQRLVRKLCPVCAGTGETQPSMRGQQVGAKCATCFGTGYKGRMAVYELMTMNDELRRLTAQRADSVLLLEAAKRAGFAPMIEDARAKIVQGLTDERELKRVLVEA
ncbi:MAG: GspE/PulE family protein [Phycisphaerales bacterium JB039]